MRLALYQPDIPQNAGAALRTGRLPGNRSDIIEPCGFRLVGNAHAPRRHGLSAGMRLTVLRTIRGWGRTFRQPQPGTPSAFADHQRRPSATTAFSSSNRTTFCCSAANRRGSGQPCTSGGPTFASSSSRCGRRLAVLECRRSAAAMVAGRSAAPNRWISTNDEFRENGAPRPDAAVPSAGRDRRRRPATPDMLEARKARAEAWFRGSLRDDIWNAFEALEDDGGRQRRAPARAAPAVRGNRLGAPRSRRRRLARRRRRHVGDEAAACSKRSASTSPPCTVRSPSGVRQANPRRRGGPALLGQRHFPGRAPARSPKVPAVAHEHALSS